MVNTDYLTKVYNTKRFQLTVKKAVKKVKALHKKLNFEAIAFTGTSGLG